jgi:hypothetical protein
MGGDTVAIDICALGLDTVAVDFAASVVDPVSVRFTLSLRGPRGLTGDRARAAALVAATRTCARGR